MAIDHPFPPIIDEHSKILILGSFPSIDSFGNAFYYGHKRNQFWPIMAEIFDETPENHDEKTALLLRNQLALWDVVKSCNRTNSLDQNLKVLEVNDLRSLTKEYPKLEAAFFTGQKAHQIYKKHFSDLELTLQVLPSSSPANTRTKYPQKLASYREALQKYKII